MSSNLELKDTGDSFKLTYRLVVWNFPDNPLGMVREKDRERERERRKIDPFAARIQESVIVKPGAQTCARADYVHLYAPYTVQF